MFNQIRQTRDRKKPSQQVQSFFLQRSCLFVHMSVSCLLNYESMVCREIIAESLPQA